LCSYHRTLLIDYRYQAITQPIYLSYDFGLSTFPCISSGYDNSDRVDCHDRPFGGGGYVGLTFGGEEFFGGIKYGIGGNTWDGLQLLPGINLGALLISKKFNIIPSMDVYFYQWPLDMRPSIRYVFGIGIQTRIWK
jgi:hypothetical protein